MSYTIGEAAKIMNLSQYTLRYYDKEGLLPMVARGSGGRREFSDADIATLKLIECLKQSGMPIKEIRRFIDWTMQGDETLCERRDMFFERREIIRSQMTELQKTLDTLSYKCWYYERAAEIGSAEAMKDIDEADMPEEIRRIYHNSVLYK